MQFSSLENVVFLLLVVDFLFIFFFCIFYIFDVLCLFVLFVCLFVHEQKGRSSLYCICHVKESYSHDTQFL